MFLNRLHIKELLLKHAIFDSRDKFQGILFKILNNYTIFYIDLTSHTPVYLEIYRIFTANSISLSYYLRQ